MAITAAELVVAFSADPKPAINAIDQVGQKMDDTSRQAQQAAGLALGAFGAGVGLAFKDAIGTAATFEQQIANVAAVGGADAQANLQEIKDAALKMGAQTAFSASEAAAGMEEMIKAGMSVKDVLGGAAQAALDLSAASGTDVALSAEIMSNALNVFGDTMTGFANSGEKAVHIADLLAQAANASATDVGELGYALSMSSAVARNFGVDIDTLGASLAILAQNGLKSSDAGTSLKQMLLSVANMSAPAKEALAELGLAAEDLVGPDGQFIGIEKMFELFRRGAAAGGLGEMDISRILGKIFGSDATRAASIFFRTNEEGWGAMRDGMANAGTAGSIAEARLNTFQGAMEALSGSIETLKIQFGQALLPALTTFAKAMMGVVNAVVSLPQPIKNVMTGVSAIAGVVAAAVGAWALFGGQIKLVLSGLLSLSPVLLAAGVAIGALVLAYKTNFMGFADAVKAGLGMVADFFSNAKQAVEFFARVFERTMKRGEHALQSFWNATRRTLKRVLGEDNPIYVFAQEVVRAVRAIKRGWDESGVQGAFGAVRKAAEKAFTRIKDVVTEQFGNAVDWLRDTGVPNLVQRLSDVRDLVAPVVEEWATTIKDTFVKKFPELLNWLANDGVPSLVVKGGELVGAIVKGITDHWGDITNWIKDHGWQLLIGALVMPVTLAAAAGAIVIGILNGLREVWATQLYPWVRDTLGWKGWQAFFQGAATWLLQPGRDVVTGIETGVIERWTTFRETVDEKVTGFKAAFADAKTWLLQAGRDIVQGLWDGVTERWNAFTADLLGKFDALPDWARAGLDKIGLSGMSGGGSAPAATSPQGLRFSGGGQPSAQGLMAGGSRGGTYDQRTINLTVHTQATDPDGVATAVLGRLYGAMDRVGAGVA
jgi:TP901 family phage tail tape measure protein